LVCESVERRRLCVHGDLGGGPEHGRGRIGEVERVQERDRKDAVASMSRSISSPMGYLNLPTVGGVTALATKTLNDAMKAERSMKPLLAKRRKLAATKGKKERIISLAVFPSERRYSGNGTGRSPDLSRLGNCLHLLYLRDLARLSIGVGGWG